MDAVINSMTGKGNKKSKNLCEGESTPGMPPDDPNDPDNIGNYKKVKDSHLKRMKIDAHSLKEDFVGRSNISKFNISVDEANNIVLTPVKKGGIPIRTGITPDDATSIYPVK